MALDLRKRQTDAITKLLHFNGAYQDEAASAEVFKVLVIDEYTLKVVATLLHTEALRQHGVTLVLSISKERESITDAPVVYFVQATEANAAAIVHDVEHGLYREAHVNFAAWAPRAILEQLAAGAVCAAATTTIAKVYDQHLNFIALEGDLFTLGLPDSYVALNDNTASESDVSTAVTQVAEGLFAVCATLSAAPLIRCASGGAAEAVGRALSAKIAAHLRGRGAALFENSGGAPGSGGRSLLCLFDRSFDLTPMVEQPFTYQALVHDCLGLSLNKVELPAQGGADGALGAKRAPIEIGEQDAFWQQNGHQEFGLVAASFDEQLKKYQEVMTSLSKRDLAGAGAGGADDAAEAAAEATKALLTTVKSLPELRAQKRKLDSHMNLLYALLHAIKARTLDKYHELGQSLLSGNKALSDVKQKVAGTEGTPADKLRLAVLYLLVTEKLPAESDTTALADALREAGADVSAFQYVLRMKQMNLTGRAGGGAAAAGAAPGGAGGWGLPGLVDSGLVSGIAGQFGKHLNKLIGGPRQAQLVTAVATLLDGVTAKQGQSPTLHDSYLTIDPRKEAGKGGMDSASASTRAAVVFMVGGGNYLERERLAQWAQQCTPKKYVLYGATELLSGQQFTEQLAVLGQKSGAAG